MPHFFTHSQAQNQATGRNQSHVVKMDVFNQAQFSAPTTS